MNNFANVKFVFIYLHKSNLAGLARHFELAFMFLVTESSRKILIHVLSISLHGALYERVCLEYHKLT